VIGPGLFSFEALWHHTRACRRRKRNTHSALAFELDLEANLMQLSEELRSHAYRPGRSICFVTDAPKPREVFAASFRDRIVHHLLVSHQERVFEPRFVHDSYACRRGKGTLAASDRAQQFLRRVTANGRRGAYALHLDVASFFPSIHKPTLAALLERRVRHPELRWLARVLLFHDPTRDYAFKPGPGRVPPPGSPGYPVPARKSLFGKGNERGLPIGNLTSQFWANVYLDALDQHVKRVLRAPLYLRYMDDLLLLSADPDELLAWREEIARFLAERLRLALRDADARPTPVRAGVDFVGWRTWWDRRRVLRAAARRFEARLDAWERALVEPRGRSLVSVRLSAARAPSQIEALRASLAAAAGHLRRGGRRTWEAAWEARPWLGAVFARDGARIAPRWPARALARAAGRPWELQRVLARGAGDACLVFRRIGCFVEFHGPQRLLAERVLGLRSALLPRGPYQLTAGFPARSRGRWRRRALAAGCAVVEVREPDRPAGESGGPRDLVVWAPASRDAGGQRAPSAAGPPLGRLGAPSHVA
jgi:retron-type reverse transcriptase